MAVTTRNRAEAGPEFSIGRFLRDTYDELRKVVWPTWGELYRYTLVVIVTVIILGVFIGGVDYSLTAILRKFLYPAT
jgi:preprotein translocase subunit SecE